MAIAFTCPHCGEQYKSDKDQLIGMRVTCRKDECRKVFVVPTTAKVSVAPASVSSPAPAVAANSTKTTPPPSESFDAEALAAAAWAEEPAPQKDTSKEVPIEVTCPGCDFKWTVPSSMAGKNVLCPECKMRVRVPMPVVEKPKDWRNQDDGRPSLARRDVPDLEGATKTTMVSGESIRQARANVIEEREPVSVLTWIKRGVFLLAFLGLAGFGVVYLMRERDQGQMQSRVNDALEEQKNADIKASEHLAALRRAAGEYEIRSAKEKQQLDAALKHLRDARGQLANMTVQTHERSALLVELAATMVYLGGSDEEVENDARLKWDLVNRELRQTLEKLPPDSDLRLWAIRRVTRKLAERQQGARASNVAQFLFAEDQFLEAKAQVALELILANQTEEAQKIADTLFQHDASRGITSVQALSMALGANKNFLTLEATGDPPLAARLGYAEGFAFQGRWQEALTVARRSGNPEHQLRALAVVAAVAMEKAPGEGEPALTEAVALIPKVRTPQSAVSPWVLLRLAHAAGRMKKPEHSKSIAEGTNENDFKVWLKAETLRGLILSNGDAKPDEAWLTEIGTPDKPTPGHVFAAEIFARAMTATGNNGFLKSVEDWPIGTLRPFGFVGLSLGALDYDAR
jgi:hypothetical protein